MKTLLLLRHAQTLPAESGNDNARRLTPAGLADAQALGRVMKKTGLQPEFALCSPALRTRETLEALMQSLAPAKTQYPEKLYNASRNDILAFIRNANNETGILMVVGHNPGIHELTGVLAGESSDMLLGRLAAGYKPGTLSVFECPAKNWADIKPGANILKHFLEPLDYNAPATPARWT